MLTFPNIAAPSYSGLSETHKDYTKSMEVENDTILTRRGATGRHRSWELKWNAMKTADYETLKDFYDNQAYQCALTFNWTFPIDVGNSDSGKSIKVRFKSELKADLEAPNRWNVSVTLEEA